MLTGPSLVTITITWESIVQKKKLIDVEAVVLRHLEQGTFKYSSHALGHMADWSISFDDVRQALERGIHWEHLDSFGRSHRKYFGKSHRRWNYALIDESVPERPIKVIVSFYKKRKKERMDIDTVMVDERLILRRPAGF